MFSAWRKFAFGFALLPLLAATAQSIPAANLQLTWHPWSKAIFTQAKLEHRFVLLDLEAVWCHWCHVMDNETYANPEVRRELQQHYLLVRVDQDARPDLSNRYEDYGWPATVVFNAEGGEIVKRQGYLPPKLMLSMLRAIVQDPSPGPSVVPQVPIVYSSAATISASVLGRLNQNFDLQYDAKAAGWGFGHKYLDADSVEHAMLLALHGDRQEGNRVRATLADEQKLIDPVWGGADQYSVDGNWDEPHYEKLIGVQADVIRIYALAYAQWHDPAYRRAAEKVHGYVETFLTSPVGTFYVSQDADLKDGKESDAYYALDNAGRRKLGIPRVDKHLYARENGWMIAAFCQLYASTGDKSALNEAERAADWITAHRSLPGGGFRHDEHDAAGPYLGDTLAMGRAYLSLYIVTGDRKWLTKAQDALAFIDREFQGTTTPGFLTSKTATDPAYRPHPERDENVRLLRFANILYQYTGNRQAKQVSMRVMRYLSTPVIALQPMAGSVLLAVAEFEHEPIHVTIVGARQNPAARVLFSVALASPSAYKRIEWWDPAQQKPLRTDVTYPKLSHPAAFLCRQRSCSMPMFHAAKLEVKIDDALRHPQA